MSFERTLLASIHIEVRQAFPDIESVMQAASVTRSDRTWFVHIITHTTPALELVVPS